MPGQEMNNRYDADVIIIGGGPAGAALGTFLAREGYSALILERDIHPREHVGEALTPSTNIPLHKLGVLSKLNDAGFVHKNGLAWNGPGSPMWKFLEVKTTDYPLAGSPQPYSFQVERGDFDAILLRHAAEAGAKVVQGATVQRILFENDRAVGVRARIIDGWERDLRARIVVDASGRRSVIGNQLKMKRKDDIFNQYSIWSWFEGVKEPPAHMKGHTLFYFVGIPLAWCWQIPLRHGKTSMGIVVDKETFKKSGKSHEEFFDSVVGRNRTFTSAMEDARRIRTLWVEGDYSYSLERPTGPGWLIAGDAFRFVDPIFSSGVDVALYSGMYAYEAIKKALTTGDEEEAFAEYAERVTGGVDVWYQFTSLFYRLPNVMTRFLTSKRWRENTIRALQGNPYDPESRARARKVIEAMEETYGKAMADPENLLRGLDENGSGPSNGLSQSSDMAPLVAHG